MVIVKKGDNDISGLTDNTISRRLSPKCAELHLHLLKNAKSNAEHNRLDADHLVVDNIQVSFHLKLYIFMLGNINV